MAATGERGAVPGVSSGRRVGGGAPRMVRASSLQRFYRQLLGCQDLGFEANGELVGAAARLVAAARLERQRRSLERQGLELLCAGCQRQAGPPLLAAQELAGDQRQELAGAAARVDRAAGFVRRLNGAIDGGRAWLCLFLPDRSTE